MNMRCRDSPTVGREWNVVALIKGNERYIFVYDDASYQEMIDDIRGKAANPNHPINWYDAAILTERIRAAHNADSLPISGDLTD